MTKPSIHIETLGNGPDLVFLHGWAMHSGVWKGVCHQLASHHRIHLIDLPGHGQSPPLASGDFDQVVEIIQDKLPEHCTICGWSLGGQVAMGLALASPARVKKLILVSTTPCFVKQSDWPWGMESTFLQFFMENLHQNYKTTINRFLTLQIKGGKNNKITLTQLREYIFERDQPDYDALQKSLLILQTNDMRGRLHHIDQPVLLLHGENDMITHPSAAKWMNQQLKNAKLVLFSKCGHAPFISDPDKFVACINEV